MKGMHDTMTATSTIRSKISALKTADLHRVVTACGGLPPAVAKRNGGFSHWSQMPKDKLVETLFDECSESFIARNFADVLLDEEAEPKAEEPKVVKPKANAAVAVNAAEQFASLVAQMASAGVGVNEAEVLRIVAERFAAERESLVSEVSKHAVRTFRIERADAPPIDAGLQHERFPLLVKMCNARLPNGRRLNVWVWGPAGTGKTSAARSVAKAMELPFYYSGAVHSAFSLIGYTDAHGRTVRTPFREAWEHGGVFLLDEIDSSDPAELNTMNAAVDSDICAFPDKMVSRHENFILIAGANTSGRGGNASFNGRHKQDDAQLSRWEFLQWPHDNKLEEAIVGCDEHGKRAIKIVRALRKKADDERIQGAVLSARTSLSLATMFRSGLPEDIAIDCTIRKGMPDDSWGRIATAL